MLVPRIEQVPTDATHAQTGETFIHITSANRDNQESSLRGLKAGEAQIAWSEAHTATYERPSPSLCWGPAAANLSHSGCAHTQNTGENKAGEGRAREVRGQHSAPWLRALAAAAMQHWVSGKMRNKRKGNTDLLLLLLLLLVLQTATLLHKLLGKSRGIR